MGEGRRQPRVSRLPRRGGLASFGHENSAPLVAQNHPPSIDPYSVFSSRLHKKRERERDISRGMADRYVNNLIFAREKKKERRNGERHCWDYVKRVLIRDTFRRKIVIERR